MQYSILNILYMIYNAICNMYTNTQCIFNNYQIQTLINKNIISNHLLILNFNEYI